MSASEPAGAELMRRAYEAWSEDDLEALLALTSEDYEFRPAQLFAGIKPVYRGHDGLAEYWHSFRSGWETLRIEMERAIELDDGRVLALLTFHGQHRDGQVEVIYRYAHVARFTGDACDRLWGYAGWEEALREHGLPVSLASGNGR